jgi:hypothetical protein
MQIGFGWLWRENPGHIDDLSIILSEISGPKFKEIHE